MPFDLTSAQRIAAWDIIKDLEKPTPMNRLLQGDVGSGKTVVAGLVACQSCSGWIPNGNYGTDWEILAFQHAETLNKLLEPFDIKVGLLTGSVKGKNRQTLLDQIERGRSRGYCRYSYVNPRNGQI